MAAPIPDPGNADQGVLSPPEPVTPEPVPLPDPPPEVP